MNIRLTRKSRVLAKVLLGLLALSAMYLTSPEKLIAECQGDRVPRYCVD